MYRGCGSYLQVPQEIYVKIFNFFWSISLVLRNLCFFTLLPFYNSLVVSLLLIIYTITSLQSIWDPTDQSKMHAWLLQLTLFAIAACLNHFLLYNIIIINIIIFWRGKKENMWLFFGQLLRYLNVLSFFLPFSPSLFMFRLVVCGLLCLNLSFCWIILNS